jgi:uncharacterized membrane protein
MNLASEYQTSIWLVFKLFQNSDSTVLISEQGIWILDFNLFVIPMVVESDPHCINQVKFEFIFFSVWDKDSYSNTGHKQVWV